MLRRTFLLSSVPLLHLACSKPPVQAAPQGSAYALGSSPDGDVYMVWIETVEARHDLQLAQLEGDRWSEPRIVATGGDEWFVNWADHPTVSAGSGGRLMVTWSYRPESAKGSKWGLATRMVFSSDGGRNWRTAHDLGPDNTADYTGFMGFGSSENGFRAAYLAPLAVGAAQHNSHIKTLRYAEFDTDGTLLSDELLDADVCTCCPLATTETATGPAVVYRDHEQGEIRDISIVRRVGGKWTAPQPVHRDGWEINGCPTNGAVIEASGDQVATAWFTAAHDNPQVLAAFSNDAGATFGEPVRVDGGAPTGWAGIAHLADGRVAVSWLEKRPQEPGVGDLMLRILEDGKEPLPPKAIAQTSSGREAGIPQVVSSGDRLVLAWRNGGRIETSVVDKNELLG